jgi:L-ascorbate metabolism protein UlaG (beta-lactamase superfamily)
MLEKIKWLGHASFKIDWDKKIYIDPWEIQIKELGDLILVTHSHFDHCSQEDIEKLASSNTVIIAPHDCKPSLGKIGDFKMIAPNEKTEVFGINIETIPAYNIEKQFHPKEKNWVGYLITIEGTKIYHSGDTDFIPEMEGLEVDIALLPIGGTYTMNAKESAQAAKAMNAKVVIPMHYGKIVGDESDLEEFKSYLPPEIKLQVLSPA